MPSEILCSQLTVMSQALQQVVRIVSSMDLKAEQQAISKKACQDYQVHSRGDHRRAQQRGKDIEDRKEFIENQRNALVGVATVGWVCGVRSVFAAVEKAKRG